VDEIGHLDNNAIDRRYNHCRDGGAESTTRARDLFGAAAKRLSFNHESTW
jgi:hypothetical protein